MCFLLTAHQHPGGTGPSVLTAVPELRLPALAPQGCGRGVHPACSALGRTGFWDEQGQVPAQPTGSREHSPPHGSLTPGVSDSHEPTTNLTPGQDVIKEVCPQRLTSSHIRGGRMPNTVLPESRRHIHAGSAAATPASLAPTQGSRGGLSAQPGQLDWPHATSQTGFESSSCTLAAPTGGALLCPRSQKALPCCLQRPPPQHPARPGRDLRGTFRLMRAEHGLLGGPGAPSRLLHPQALLLYLLSHFYWHLPFCL